jgi:hypothetical protein
MWLHGLSNPEFALLEMDFVSSAKKAVNAVAEWADEIEFRVKIPCCDPSLSCNGRIFVVQFTVGDGEARP